MFFHLLQSLPQPNTGQQTDWVLYVFALAIGGLFIYYANNVKKTIELLEENFEKGLAAQKEQSEQNLTAQAERFKELMLLHKESITSQMSVSESLQRLTDSIQILTQQTTK